MRGRILTVLLLVGVALVALSFVTALSGARLPGDDRDYRPVQPIQYSHRVHAGELAIPCLYCHFGAERSRHAGVPALSVCMNCHRSVTAPLSAVRDEERQAEAEGRAPRPVVSEELRKLYAAQGLNDRLEPDPSGVARSIEWVRVHSLPDFVAFDHRPHVAAGVACQNCHGPIETMDRVRQFSSLSMGWCVGCHRDTSVPLAKGEAVRASLDCATCHY